MAEEVGNFPLDQGNNSALRGLEQAREEAGRPRRLEDVPDLLLGDHPVEVVQEPEVPHDVHALGLGPANAALLLGLGEVDRVRLAVFGSLEVLRDFRQGDSSDLEII